MTHLSDDRREIRLALVREHVRMENLHDLEGILKTFGNAMGYEDQAWRSKYPGIEGVRTYYETLLEASSDLQIEVTAEYVSDAAVILEMIIRGTHTGEWYGLPSTGYRFEFPLCAVYSFDENDRLAGERIYYDRATVMSQFGVLREPLGFFGRLAMGLNHPLTIIRAYARKLTNR